MPAERVPLPGPRGVDRRAAEPASLPLLTAAEMRAVDRATIDGGHASAYELMERAGAAVARALEARYGSPLGLRVLVLCGPGHNGGDGFVAARHLRARGAEVHAGLCGERARVKGDALRHLEALEAANGPLAAAAGEEAQRALVGRRDHWDYAVDALLGTGAHGELEGAIASAAGILRELDDSGTRVIAIDLPTGVDSDTGAIARRAVRADLTVTIQAPKRGLWLHPGRAFAGAIEVADLGMLSPPPGGGGVVLATAAAMAALLPRREPRAHKGTAGRVVVAGGSPGLTGAVALAARAATRAGAGYVQVAVPESLVALYGQKLTEEMAIGCAETRQHTLATGAFGALRDAIDRAHVAAIGSGLSRDPDSADLVRQIVTESERPVVIDADGLNAFESRTASLSRARAERVLTPHLGEMSRLTAVDSRALEERRIDAPREWAREWRSIVVMKGAPTVVAAPDGRTSVNPTGNAGMATAGMGDVLTGVIAALIAQGLDGWDAARLGVFLHGMAGDRVAESLGAVGMCAGDVIEDLPRARAGLGLARAARPR